MDTVTFYGRQGPPRRRRPESVDLVANNIYAEVRQLLKFPKRGRRLCRIRENVRTADLPYFKGKTLRDVIDLATVPVTRQWWVRHSEHGDANELVDPAAPVQIRRHRREPQWVQTDNGHLCKELLDRGFYVLIRVERARR